MSTAYDRLQPEIRKYYERYQKNGIRATILIAHAELDKTGNAPDLLRAAVVFLHATLEDFLRTVLSDRAERLDPTKLSKLPLVGLDYSATKHTLQELLKHKDKNVGDLINESIRSWLQRTSFNEISDITGMLTTFSIDFTKCKPYFDDTGAMIKRRHQIVHNADLVEVNGTWTPQAIEIDVVRAWVSAVTHISARIIWSLNEEAKAAVE